MWQHLYQWLSTTIASRDITILPDLVYYNLRSPLRHLYDNGDESFLNLTGFSGVSIEEMHQYLYVDVQKQTSPGRRRLLSSQDE